jgi:hypothetical protein
MGQNKIKNKCKLLLLSCFLSFVSVVAQNDLENIISLDLDGDRLNDTISSITNSEEVQFQCTLSGKKALIKTPFLKYVSQNFYFEQLKNTFSICFQNNRSLDEYIFEFNRTAKKIQLIAYKSENYGNASQEGSGKTLIDLKLGKLITNHLVMNAKSNTLVNKKQNKKIKIAPIYFTDFDDAIIEKLYSN